MSLYVSSIHDLLQDASSCVANCFSVRVGIFAKENPSGQVEWRKQEPFTSFLDFSLAGDGVHGVRQRLIHGPKVLVGLVSSHMAGKTGLVQGCQTGVTETGERSTSANEEHVSEWVTKG